MFSLAFILVAITFSSSALKAQDGPAFEAGSVFVVTMTKTMANEQQEYLRMLNAYFLPRLEREKEEGLILSYKVLAGADANPDDFDLMVLVEYENMAALDPSPEKAAKRAAIQKELLEKLGGQEKLDAIIDKYPEVRTIYGRKLMRERAPAQD